MTITTRPACDEFGCFVEGLQISRASVSEIVRCRELLSENGTLFFRGQNLNQREQIGLTEQMGEMRRITLEGVPLGQLAEA